MGAAVSAAAANRRGGGGAGRASLVPEARRPRLGVGRGAQDPRRGSRSRRHVSRVAGGVPPAGGAAWPCVGLGADAAGAAADGRGEGPRGRRARGRRGRSARGGAAVCRGHGGPRGAGGAASRDLQGRRRPRFVGSRVPQTGGVKLAWGVGGLDGRLTEGQGWAVG